MTMVDEVRVTSVYTILPLTSASHPAASDCAESIPAIRAVVMALSAPTVATHVSPVNVITKDSPPALICASVAPSDKSSVNAAVAPAAP